MIRLSIPLRQALSRLTLPVLIAAAFGLVGCALMLAGLLACQLLPNGDARKKDEDALPA